MSETISVPPGYRFLRNINDGGFGTVIEVSENSTGEHFAVKMMRCISEKDKERIGREVHRLQTFVHPHIVRLKEVVAMENMQAIVMELGEQSLAQVVKSHSERGVLIDRHIVYQVMVDISSALCFMHNDAGERTAHGDVKLENILLFGDGHAKLCDLGAAESEDVSSTRGVMSMQYVSPERLEDAQEQTARLKDQQALMEEKERTVQLQTELRMKQTTRQREKEKALKTQNELMRKMEEMTARHAVRVVRSRNGADAIEWYPAGGFSLSGSVFTFRGRFFECSTLLSFSFGKVVARFTFTITRITGWNWIGIIASSQTEEVKKGQIFVGLLGEAGWDVSEQSRAAFQNENDYSEGSACAAGKEGPRVVLEADGRDGKRTLRLSQDGQTQPTFFSNIPVPFRFAIYLSGVGDSVSIESVNGLTEPTLFGGTTEIRMDE
ncbi:putative Protein kinase domain containing protein [Blattamonas nauphoetae]|uniref:mitogen-activated protein kinase kinase n=1 Tax=Blattamonas nauphoetae TaxID=2049346 RepID=A0ABQ9WXM8_9EUKA|nr:putative Protein kinase domain containing protein [Blattamonas nauphoetae]